MRGPLGAALLRIVSDSAAVALTLTSAPRIAGVKFINAVITGSTFEGADLSNADFEDALIGSEDAKRLCLNPTLTGESRAQVGCRGK